MSDEPMFLSATKEEIDNFKNLLAEGVVHFCCPAVELELGSNLHMRIITQSLDTALEFAAFTLPDEFVHSKGMIAFTLLTVREDAWQIRHNANHVPDGILFGAIVHSNSKDFRYKVRIALEAMGATVFDSAAMKHIVGQTAEA